MHPFFYHSMLLTDHPTVNLQGSLFIILGLLFLLLEIPVTSYGLLTLLGITSLFFGLNVFFNGFEVFAILLGLGLFYLWVGVFWWKDSRLYRKLPSFHQLVGEKARVIGHLTPPSSLYQVRVNGEIWTAKNLHPEQTLAPGDMAQVVSKDESEFLLIIKKIEHESII